MGIKGLNAFLRKECPEAFITLPYSYFYGKRIAIDSDNLLMKLMSRAQKEIVDKTDVATKEPDREEVIEKWIYHIKNFITDWLKNGAHPIFVFDGKHLQEKSMTQKKRKKEKTKRKNQYELMKNKISMIDELERTPDMINTLRKLLNSLGSVYKDDKEMIKELLIAAGIPVITAKADAERLCAMLCIEGKVSGVYSRDTDLIAYGCPLIINEEAGFSYNSKKEKIEPSVKCTVFKPVLSKLKLEYNSFLDLCIMAGCDYNDNIPHLGIGKSYNILKEYKTIDNLPEKYHIKSKCVRKDHENCLRINQDFQDQTKCLNHVKCRDIFKHVKCNIVSETKIILNIDKNLSRDKLEFFNIDHWIDELLPLYNNLPEPKDIYIRRNPSLAHSLIKLKIVNCDNKIKLDGHSKYLVQSK